MKKIKKLTKKEKSELLCNFTEVLLGRAYHFFEHHSDIYSTPFEVFAAALLSMHDEFEASPHHMQEDLKCILPKKRKSK